MTPTTDQLKDLLAKVTPGEWRGEWTPGEYSEGRVWIGDHDPIRIEGGNYCRYDATCEDGGESRFEAETHLIALAPTLAAEVVRLRAIIEKVDQYAPVADDTCDEPGITFTEAIMRKWPEYRPPSP